MYPSFSIKTILENHGYGWVEMGSYGNIAYLSTKYPTSEVDTANNGLHLYDAYILTKDEKYLIAATEQIHYLLGRNLLGLCYLTGCGTDAIKHPHHRPSEFFGKAMPGMLSGGPCDWFADDTVKQIFTKDTAPAKSRRNRFVYINSLRKTQAIFLCIISIILFVKELWV